MASDALSRTPSPRDMQRIKAAALPRICCVNPTSAKRPPSVDVSGLFFWGFLTNKQTVAEKFRPWAMPLGAEDGLATNGASVLVITALAEGAPMDAPAF